MSMTVMHVISSMTVMTDMRVISMTVFTEVCLLCPAIPLHKCFFETLLPVSSRLLREYIRRPLHYYVLIGKL